MVGTEIIDRIVEEIVKKTHLHGQFLITDEMLEKALKKCGSELRPADTKNTIIGRLIGKNVCLQTLDGSMIIKKVCRN